MDASGVGLRAVLLQGEEGERKPVAFLSRKIFPRETRYATVEKECLVIKWALDSDITSLDDTLCWRQTTGPCNGCIGCGTRTHASQGGICPSSLSILRFATGPDPSTRWPTFCHGYQKIPWHVVPQPEEGLMTCTAGRFLRLQKGEEM